MQKCFDFKTPRGLFRIRASDSAITEISRQRGLPTDPDPRRAEATPLIRKAHRQVLEFLSGRRRQFELPLHPEGTAFQMTIWKELQKLPWGSAVTYSEIAKRIGSPRAARAVGTAIGKNPILFAIPCHRVVAAGGRLGGFSAGLDLKLALLSMESDRPTSFADVHEDSSSRLHI